MSDNEPDTAARSIRVDDPSQFGHDMSMFAEAVSTKWFLDKYPLRDDVAESVAEATDSVEGPDEVLAVLEQYLAELQDRHAVPEAGTDPETVDLDFGSGLVTLDKSSTDSE
jgi:hypothetical protein